MELFSKPDNLTRVNFCHSSMQGSRSKLGVGRKIPLTLRGNLAPRPSEDQSSGKAQ